MLAIIDYGYGNIKSVHNALVKIGADDIMLTNSPDIIAKASRIVLPGVGAFAQCMGGLVAIDGMVEALNKRVLKDAVPFLGICVGMQLLADHGVEFETTKGLGWVKGEVTRLSPQEKATKIPHMGWNQAVPKPGAIFEKAWNNRPEDVYFVHSFAFRCEDSSDIAASCNYGGDNFAAAIQKDNIFGVQFHPEKSQKAGLNLLQTWLETS